MTSSAICASCGTCLARPAPESESGAVSSAGWAGEARAYGARVEAWLGSSQTDGLDLAALEEALVVHAHEHYRLLLQARLDLAAARERRRVDVVGSDQVPRPRVEVGHQRGLTTVFGKVRVTRMAYRAGAGGQGGAATSGDPVGPDGDTTGGDAMGGDATVGDATVGDATVGDGPMMEGGSAGADAVPAAGRLVGDGPTTGAEPVTVDEARVQPAGRVRAGNLYPADAVLNLPLGGCSPGLSGWAAVEAARGSYEEARDGIERATGVALSKRQIEELARGAAVDVDPFYQARRPDPAPPERCVILQADGKGVVMRPDGLRPGTARAAASAARKLATRLSPGEKHGRKRMAEVITVYDLEPVPRTVDDIIPPVGARRRDRSRAARARGPVATGKWLAASLVDDIPTMIGKMFAEADRRDPTHARTWIALVDGNTQQIDQIQAQAAARGIKVTVIIDVIHVVEYLWTAAWAFHSPGDPNAETWVADLARTVLHGRAVDAAATITHRANTTQLTASGRKNVNETVAYLTSKRAWLDYPTALATGWPIATGVVEGACRHLVIL